MTIRAQHQFENSVALRNVSGKELCAFSAYSAVKVFARELTAATQRTPRLRREEPLFRQTLPGSLIFALALSPGLRPGLHSAAIFDGSLSGFILSLPI